MNFQQLISFQAAADLESFSQAAEQCNYSQSAVTLQIQQLEEEFGIRLFDRIGKRVNLTSDGKRFLEHTQRILHEINRTYLEINGEGMEFGHLRIGCIDSLCNHHLPQILWRYYQDNPSYTASVYTGSPSHLLNLLNRNQLDIVYILDQPLYDNNWKKELEKDVEIRFITCACSPLAGRKHLRLADLMSSSFFLTEKKDNYRYALDQKLASLNLNANTRLEVSNTDVILSLLCSGEGVSFMPEFAFQKQLADGGVKILDVEDFRLSMQLQIFYHKNKWVSREMTEFIRIAKELI